MKLKDLINYLILIAAFVVGAAALYINRFNGADQFAIVVALAFFYLVWGLFHHSTKKDLDKKLFLEYILIAAIALVMGFFLFLK